MHTSIRIDDNVYDAEWCLHPKPVDYFLGFFVINCCPDLLSSDHVYFHTEINDISMMGYAVLDRNSEKAESSHLKELKPCRFNVLWFNNSQDVVWGI